ncbi:MAG: helix-turn-helix transcriptional regulator [Planctomycetaceae bacterium]|nr:helix-turn-helix transcriptional regulator [Planctomycetaceae bacterium]
MHAATVSNPSMVHVQTPTVIIGEFRCVPTHPSFREDTCADVAWPSMAFPRVPIGFRFEGRDPEVADQNSVVLFNPGVSYRRFKIDERGSQTDWIEIRPDVLAAMIAPHDPTVYDRPGSPFTLNIAQAPSVAYMLQRMSFLAAKCGGCLSLAAAEEQGRKIARAVVDALYDGSGGGANDRLHLESRHRAVANDVKTLLALNMRAGMSLSSLSDAVGVSPFHLCRVFRRITGTTIHRYLDRLRLRASLELLGETQQRLASIALTVGYSSESHFSDAFHREFSMRPSKFRESTQPMNLKGGRSAAFDAL